MKRIGFVTSVDDPTLINDDNLAVPFLEYLGISMTPVVWDHWLSHDFSDYDALIFRSCWNYHRKYEEFQQFLTSLKRLKIPILNPLAVIEWNLNKKHILELGHKVLVPKTRWFKTGSPFVKSDLTSLVSEWRVEQLVLKPAVSLNGQDTYLVKADDWNTIERIVVDLLKQRDVLIQEYIPEIKISGEISLVYFNKKFSHAVRKVPAENEFRVHSEYGGTREAVTASSAALNYGQSVLSQIEQDILYARVDLVESGRGPILIELELTDPMLYLATEPTAARNFAQAIDDALGKYWQSEPID